MGRGEVLFAVSLYCGVAPLLGQERGGRGDTNTHDAGSTNNGCVCLCVCDAQSLNKLKVFAMIHHIYNFVRTATMF